jgi:competence protein ComEC
LLTWERLVTNIVSVLIVRRMRKVLPIIVIVAALCVAFYVWRARHTHGRTGPTGPVLTITFLDAKTGGGIVVQTPDNELAVIDPGPESTASDLASYLEDQGAQSITAIVTSPSPERAGALKALLESFKIKRLVRGEMDSHSRLWTDTIEQARSRGVPELVLSAGDSIGVSRKVRLGVLSPPRGLIKQTDAGSPSNSLVARISFGNVRLLLCSDAGTQTEGHLISSKADMQSDALVVGRHGGSEATSLEFISFVRPRYFIVTAGGRLGRPSRAVLSRIDARNTGAEVYRTDREGRIALITDGRTIAVETERGGRE